MNEIGKINRLQNQPERPRSDAAEADVPSSRALVASEQQVFRPKAASSEARYTNARPAAAFLTQFIDQHGNWPRAPMRRLRRLDTATSAYQRAETVAERQRYALAPRQRDIEL